MRKLILILSVFFLTSCSVRYFDTYAIGVPYLPSDLYMTNVTGGEAYLDLRLMFVPTGYSIPGVSAPDDKSWNKCIQNIVYKYALDIKTVQDEQILFFDYPSDAVSTLNIYPSPTENGTITVNNTGYRVYTYNMGPLYVKFPEVCSNFDIKITNILPPGYYNGEQQLIYTRLQELAASAGTLHITVVSNTTHTLWSNRVELLSNNIYRVTTFSEVKPVGVLTLLRNQHNFGIKRMSGDGDTWTDFNLLYDDFGTYDGVNHWSIEGYYHVNPELSTNLSPTNARCSLYFEMSGTDYQYPLYNPGQISFGFWSFQYREGIGYDTILIK